MCLVHLFSHQAIAKMLLITLLTSLASLSASSHVPKKALKADTTTLATSVSTIYSEVHLLVKRQDACQKAAPTPPKPSSTTTSLSPYISTVPQIDVCGAASPNSNVSCPGAGTNGYYYRCCSGAGHCGPKNPLQDQALYCGVDNGCQKGFSNGKCGGAMKPPAYSSLPADPSKSSSVAQAGETCGPIPNRRCADGLCCSGSNYCGTGVDFCGSANWCQVDFGRCDGS